MPTYDYLCPNGHRFEVIHSVTAEGPSNCPICGAAPVRKAFTAPTIHFKGTGWAKKDRSSTTRSSTHAATADRGPDSDSQTGSGDSGSGSTGTGSGSGTDHADGASSDTSKSSDAKKASDKGSSNVTPKPKGPASSSGSTAGD